MSPETVTSDFDGMAAPRPSADERQQFRLPALGITIDKYGRAHDASTGEFMTGRVLSQENAQTMALWQEYIIENAPDKQAKQLMTKTPPTPVLRPNRLISPPIPEASALESVSHWDRAKRKFRHAANELQLLPQTAMQLAQRGGERLSRRAETSPRNRILASVAAGFVVAGAAGRSYASVKYGYSSGGTGMPSPEKHAALAELTPMLLGRTAVNHTASHSAKHELLSQLQFSGTSPSATTSPGKHQLVAELHYSGNGSGYQHDATTQLSNPGKHKLWSELKYNPQSVVGPETHGHLHAGFLPKEVFVEHGHGITQEYVDIAQHHGFSLTGEESYRAYNYVNAHVHGHFFEDDQMYHLPNGDWGISHPGMAHWTPAERHWLHRWLMLNGKIAE